MTKPAALLTLAFLISCNTPEDKLERLKHDFWENFARQDFYEIKLRQEVLHLPLPPPTDRSGQQKFTAEELQKRANAIVKEKLSAENQHQLLQLRNALDECVAHSGMPFFDPSRCCISETLEQYAAHPELPVVLEQIKPYYEEIEKRWQTPDIRFIPKAIAGAQTSLDHLENMEKQTGKAQYAQTRAAVKDFIGLCLSAYLQ